MQNINPHSTENKEGSNFRLAKIEPNTNQLCPRCKGQPANLVLCSGDVRNFFAIWKSIFEAFSEIFWTQLDPDTICTFLSFSD